MLHWICQAEYIIEEKCPRVGEGSTKFLFGAVLGATTGFAAGFFAATPTVRSAGKSTVGGLGDAARFVGQTAVRTVDYLGLAIEAGYTRVLGREKYLEHEIEELRDQITRLEQRID